MRTIKILWADDEIELLKPHIMFLTAKGYDVTSVNNGNEAIEEMKNNIFDIVFLDEQMPGLGGIETLDEIKQINPDIPVVMITKSEEENIMEAAIGSKISDYLIKPVNPNQILLSLKKTLSGKELVSQKTTSSYQADFNKLGSQILNCNSWNDFVDIYKKLVSWELQFGSNGDNAMDEILRMQKNDANTNFVRFITENYIDWLHGRTDGAPLMSPNFIRHSVMPLLKNGEKVMLLVIDNLRYDQWLTIKSLLNDYYTTVSESLVCSILPTTTQYARNALFAGLMPSEIDKLYPNFWLDDNEEGIKNKYEEELCRTQLKRLGYTDKIFFEKVTAINAGKKLRDKLSQIVANQLSVVVYNFVDTLSHARTEMDMIKELASDEAAYRSLTASWFTHSPLYDVLKELSQKGVTIVVMTDHGSIRIDKAVKILGDREVTNNLRYKQGKALKYNAREVFEITCPQDAFLPATNLSSTYVFAQSTDFFLYPNNYNYYNTYYRDTFQHGGISMEEMIIPLVVLKAK